MKKGKNARSLDEIAERINKRGRHSIIEDGEDLLEAKEQCEPGQWLAWLDSEFAWSEDTAERYMKVAKLTAEFRSLRNLQLAKTTLYALTDQSAADLPAIIDELAKHATKTRLRPRDAERVIKIGIGRSKWNDDDAANNYPDATLAALGGLWRNPDVDSDEFERAVDALVERQPETDEDAQAVIDAAIVDDDKDSPDDDEDDEDDHEEEDDDEGASDTAGSETNPAEDADDSEIEKMLAGPSPDVPPPAPLAAPPDYDLRRFDQAIDTLKALVTKPGAKLAGTGHDVFSLQNVRTLIDAVIAAKTKSPAPETAEDSADKRKETAKVKSGE